MPELMLEPPYAFGSVVDCPVGRPLVFPIVPAFCTCFIARATRSAKALGTSSQRSSPHPWELQLFAVSDEATELRYLHSANVFEPDLVIAHAYEASEATSSMSRLTGLRFYSLDN
jgi:hypothetical protein